MAAAGPVSDFWGDAVDDGCERSCVAILLSFDGAPLFPPPTPSMALSLDGPEVTAVVFVTAEGAVPARPCAPSLVVALPPAPPTPDCFASAPVAAAAVQPLPRSTGSML